MKIQNTLKSMLSLVVCLSFAMPLVNVANAQDDNAALIALLKNKQKLQAQAKKFDAAIARLKPLASKSKFDKKDIEIIDSFINETDDGVPIATRAQSKAFAAAQNVKAFEEGVKAAVRGKDAKEFVAALENNPSLIYEVNGAREAGNAFTNSIKEDAAVLKAVGKRLEAQGNESNAQNTFNNSGAVFIKASFSSNDVCSTRDSLLNVSDDVAETNPSLLQSGLVEAALIALAVAYLGFLAYRLTSGAIKTCVDRAIVRYRDCIRRRSAGGLTFGEELLCRGIYLQDVSLCVLLPI